jgi:ectoine hydroxylase-related dioxygenase (phytanoyl-CoA dioxygenase family)
MRIHLEDTDQTNGVLRVVPGSHAKRVYRAEDIDWSIEREVICDVQRGGIMLMKPLLLHASSRTTSNRRRRVDTHRICQNGPARRSLLV